MGDGGEENDSETFLESVDAAGGSQACGEGRGEGDGGAAVSGSCVRDAAVAAVVESCWVLGWRGRSYYLAPLVSRRQHRTRSWPILMPQSVEEIICQSSHSTSVQVWAFSFWLKSVKCSYFYALSFVIFIILRMFDLCK